MKREGTGDANALARIAEYERRYAFNKPGKDRPSPVPVEETFDRFVADFGGKKISDLLENKSQMPLNADYFFREHNAIVELKTIEGAFAGFEGVRSFNQAFIDSGYTLDEAFLCLLGQSGMPNNVRKLIMRRMRRAIEQVIVKARKQTRMSKSLFGNDSTRCLIIVAMDQPPLFGHDMALLVLGKLMGDNYSDKFTDGVIYINPNVPTRVNPDGMEYGGWFPFYRDDDVNDSLSKFVNLLGNRWLHFFAKQTGSTNPILEFENIEDSLVVLNGQTLVTDEILKQRG